MLANGKDHVTEQELRAALPADKADFLVRTLKPFPGVPGAFDFKRFTGTSVVVAVLVY